MRGVGVAMAGLLSAGLPGGCEPARPTPITMAQAEKLHRGDIANPVQATVRMFYGVEILGIGDACKLPCHEGGYALKIPSALIKRPEVEKLLIGAGGSPGPGLQRSRIATLVLNLNYCRHPLPLAPGVKPPRPKKTVCSATLVRVVEQHVIVEPTGYGAD